nr:MAG TPA: hypothetical protein [Caudoviricetes sp.]
MLTEIHIDDIVNLVHRREAIKKWRMWNYSERK